MWQLVSVIKISYEQILRKFLGNLDIGSQNRWLNFGDYLNPGGTRNLVLLLHILHYTGVSLNIWGNEQMKINVETVMKTLVNADIRYQLASWMITKQTRRRINNVIRRSDDISAALQLFYRFPKPLKISVLRPQDNNNKKSINQSRPRKSCIPCTRHHYKHGAGQNYYADYLLVSK